MYLGFYSFYPHANGNRMLKDPGAPIGDDLMYWFYYAGRRLRGTGLDVFGRTAVRRTERALPGEYHEAVTRGLPRLSPATLPALVALAELPDMVRGYEHIKLGNVSRYREALRSALDDIELTAPAEPLS